MSTALRPRPKSAGSAPSRHSPVPGWTPNRVRAELKVFLAGREEWPTFREFQRNGRRSLREAVTHLGGARHWAEELGVRFVEHKPGYAPIWTEARIRSELRSFLGDRHTWPRRKDFEAAGRKTLRDAVLRTGGPERWAAEFGLPRPDERSGSRRIWTEERIERELRSFVGQSQRWPSTREFVDAGETRLQAAVYAWGGVAHWCERLSIQAPESTRAQREPLWTDRRIAAELEEFCAGRSRWPLFREFEQAGRGDLYRAASRHGGVGRWQRRLGLEP